jgi:hypothetical protein
MPGGAKRDPVSVTFDASARRLLARAYDARGTWVQAWLPDPGLRERTRWMEAGITVDGPDPMGGGGGLNARTRWARAFVRSLHYQARWYAPARSGLPLRGVKRTAPSSAPLRVEVGRHIPASPGGGLPARRRVRVMIASGGRARDAAVARLPDADRIYTPAGAPAARWADPARRDW